MSHDPLLPCPFCGLGDTQIKENGRQWIGTRWTEPVSISVINWCEPLEGQPHRRLERVGKDLESAIAAWNMRYKE